MYFMPFYINSTKRTGRTQVLTSTTSDTTLNVHNRNFRRIITFRVGSYHLYSSCRTMTSTISTINTIGQNYTIFFYPYSMPDLDRRLFRNRDGTYRSCRTNFRSFCTFRSTIPSFIRHLRLHQCHQTA